MMIKSLLAFVFALTHAVALAQTGAYPNHAVKLVVPYSPGGAVDSPTRILALKLQDLWKQGVTIENKPGAGSTIGTEFVAKSAPDGYTLLVTSNPHLISGALYKKLNYDPINDFEMVIDFGSAPNVLVVPVGFPAKSVAELVALAKAKPGSIDYASSGNGSSQHLLCALFASMTGINMNHVPYKGSAQALTDLLGGRVPVSCPGVNNVLPHLKSGKLRALGITSSRRAADLPDVPTLAEAGVTGYDATAWIGVLAPKGTPQAVQEKIAADVQRVLSAPDVKAAVQATGTDLRFRQSREFTQAVREEAARWPKLLVDTGAKVE
jgi:tripartite-type tricarboxylate transporter receptor subunit TctC